MIPCAAWLRISQVPSVRNSSETRSPPGCWRFVSSAVSPPVSVFHSTLRWSTMNAQEP